jgi:hypothetical protein
MSSKWSSRIFAFCAAALMALYAQETPLDQSSIKINLPPDSPLALISANMGESRALSRGSAIVLDLHMSLTLRNASADTIRGITLLVLAQEVTPGGKASVTLPALNVEPGQSFTMPAVAMQLLRPGRAAGGPLVEVDLDGVLFKNLNFYGKNRLDSRRSLTAYEVEAQRDRQYFKQVLAAVGPQGLQRDVLASLARQAERPRLNVTVRRGGGRAVASAVVSGNEHLAQFAFLKFPDSPVDPVQGSAQISGNEARTPDIEIRNKTGKPVRYVEIGWIVRDPKGAEFMAASVPASGPELYLPGGQSARVLQNSSLRFTNNAGEPVAIAGMTGFVSQVEFDNGRIWVPDRKSLQNLQLLRVLAPSTEEQRLTDLYNKKGLNALIEELNRF